MSKIMATHWISSTMKNAFAFDKEEIAVATKQYAHLNNCFDENGWIGPSSCPSSTVLSRFSAQDYSCSKFEEMAVCVCTAPIYPLSQKSRGNIFTERLKWKSKRLFAHGVRSPKECLINKPELTFLSDIFFYCDQVIQVWIIEKEMSISNYLK